MSAAALACGLVACAPDQGLSEISLDRVAVAAGDFDQVEEALTRLLVYHAVYDGYIAGPVYDSELEPGDNVLSIETLLTGTDSEGRLELYQHDAVFLNSGVRGLGEERYDDLESDDALLRDPQAVANVVSYVEDGHVLVVSDWAYDLVEAGWPDQIDFLGEDDQPDAAQKGTSELVVARVEDAALARDLGGDTLQVAFDYSHWAVVQAVADTTTVYLRGDVTLRPDDEAGEVSLPDVPLLLGFPAGRGQVVLSAFHWRAQRGAVADLLLQALLPGLAVGRADDTGAP